jgi:TPP-dependent pyruvate/acetoin dehydrogenase alpha subunit
MGTEAADPRSAAEGLSAVRRYGRMALIRAFELKVSELYRDGEIPGFVHTSLGQEAVAVGVCSRLAPDDYMATTHRGHGHCLAKGADPGGMMAELFAKETGLCHGKGGSMHVADPARGILGANAIVGASVPIAVGAGLSSRLLGQGRVSVAFFGEGSVNQGAFHEAANLAAIWDLPVLFVCENNLYAEFTDSSRMSRVPSAATRAAAYGIEAHEVDGNDVAAMSDAAARAIERCRDGAGPVLLEAHTYRWQGHYEGDAQPYKPAPEVERWKARDPLVLERDRLVRAAEATAEELAAIAREAEETVAAAVEDARGAVYPALEEAYADVLVDA